MLQKAWEHSNSSVLDNIKAIGFHYSTIGAITVSMGDIIVPYQKSELLSKAEEK